MKLSIASDSRDHAILVCDEAHNDIAEFYHNEHATVAQSYDVALKLAQTLVVHAELIKRIQDALGTAETGYALVEVARNAHKAEMELASTYNFGSFEDMVDL